MRKCPCGAYMEIREGNIDYNAKDDSGQIMSPEAAYHMGRFRLRC